MSKQDRPILLELEYTHPCWCLESVGKDATDSIRLVSPMETGPRGVDFGVFELQAEKIEVLLAHLKRHKWVRQVQVLQKAQCWALARIAFKHDSLLAQKIAKTGSLLQLPSLTRGDRDAITVLVPSDRKLRELKSLLGESADQFWLKSKVYVDSQRFSKPWLHSADLLKFQTLAGLLSEQQREAFLLASRKGYYEEPKKTSVDELASKLGVKPSTFSEHLRKAESKLYPHLAQLLETAARPNRPVKSRR